MFFIQSNAARTILIVRNCKHNWSGKVTTATENDCHFIRESSRAGPGWHLHGEFHVFKKKRVEQRRWSHIGSSRQWSKPRARYHSTAAMALCALMPATVDIVYARHSRQLYRDDDGFRWTWSSSTPNNGTAKPGVYRTIYLFIFCCFFFIILLLDECIALLLGV